MTDKEKVVEQEEELFELGEKEIREARATAKNRVQAHTVLGDPVSES